VCVCSPVVGGCFSTPPPLRDVRAPVCRSVCPLGVSCAGSALPCRSECAHSRSAVLGSFHGPPGKRTTLDRGCATQPRHTQHTQHSRATLSGCAPAQPWTHGAAHGSRCQADRAVVCTVCKPDEPKRPHAVRDDLCSTERTVTAVLERAGLPAPLPLVLNHSRLDATRRCGEAVAWNASDRRSERL